MAKAIAEHTPNRPHEIVHVQCHDIRTANDVISIRFEKIRPWKGPSGWSSRDKEVREGTQQYLLSTKAAHVAIQLRVIDLVEAAVQHDTYDAGKSVADYFPIPGRSLGVTRQYVGGDSQFLRAHVSIEKLLCRALLIHEECQIPVFAIPWRLINKSKDDIVSILLASKRFFCCSRKYL